MIFQNTPPRIQSCWRLGATLCFLLGNLGLLQANQVITIMAANLTSGNGQDYDLGHGNRIIRGLKPDITLVQEMNYLANSPANIRTWVNENFGTQFHFFREPSEQIPNGIVSRFPILQSGEWNDTTLDNRDYVWARIDIPGPKDLWAVSVHLSSGGGATQRSEQAQELVAYIQAQGIPATDYLVIGGDLNTNSRTENCLSVLSALVRTAGPYPVDQAGLGGTNASRAKPYDWVIPDADLHARRVPYVLGSNSFTDGLVFDSRVYTPLAQVPPVLAGDSGATSMQHMAVIRAFSVESDNAPPVITQGATISRSLSQNSYPTAFSLTLQATDANSNPLSWSISSPASKGTASVAAPTSGTQVAINYVPSINALGSDAFTVRVSDGQGGTDEITVQVTIQLPAAYDRWTFEQFAPLTIETQATVWGEGADPDGDGVINLAEFAFNLNPKAIDAAANILDIQYSSIDNAFLISHLMRMDGSEPALPYSIEFSTTLEPNDWSELGAGDFTQLEATVLSPEFSRARLQLATPPSDQLKGFYRLKITR
ncbi:MAG: endonuclease [Verrucomicrobia bacterium]|nr:MAG: endonuclease [Verrucomicrobiota bacterium]